MQELVQTHFIIQHTDLLVPYAYAKLILDHHDLLRNTHNKANFMEQYARQWYPPKPSDTIDQAPPS